jgi:septation ring formation regulator EzrA
LDPSASLRSRASEGNREVAEKMTLEEQAKEPFKKASPKYSKDCRICRAEQETEITVLKESAQKLQTELEDVKKIRDALGKHHNEIIAERNKFIDRAEMAEAKLAEANKILSNLEKETHPKNYILAYQHLKHICGES